jgi:hypothetical protein
MAVSLSGFLYDDSGGPIAGANVAIFPTSVGATISTSTSSATETTTTSNTGLWDEPALADNQYDVRITLSGGTSVRWLRHGSGSQYSQLSLISDTDATANQVLTLGSDNATRADNDEVFVRFVMDNDAGEVTEFARMTVIATDVSNGSEDGKIEFDVIKSGSPYTAFTITSSAGGAQSLDLNQDTITLGTATDGTDVALTFDGHAGDGVLTWMEDEDYFKFSDDILMNSTERVYFRDTDIEIYSSTDGQLDLVANTEIQIAATTVDINGAVVLNGAVTGATAITSGTIDATTDFTIGSTVITDGVITDSSGLALAANVTVTGTLLPTTDNTYDLGSASYAWQDLFLQGDITLTDAGTIATSAGDLTLDPDGNDVILLDNTALSFGTGIDSRIYYNGTDTFWDLRATGSGDLMIALEGSFPSPDANAVHIWAGTADHDGGTVTADGAARLIIEDNAQAVLQFLVPLNTSAGIYVGHNSAAYRGAIYYNNTGASPGDTWRFVTAGTERLLYSDGAFAFQQATTVSTSTGDLTLDPAAELVFNLSGGAQLYEWDLRSNWLTLQSQSDDTNSILELYSKKGDGGDDVQFSIYGVGTPGSVSNMEKMSFMFDATDAFEIRVEAAGSGTQRNLEFRDSSSTLWATFTAGGGLHLGSATGGNKGAGSINATAIWDDNSQITDYVFENDYAQMAIHEMRDFYTREKHLPTIPGRDEWDESGGFPLGKIATHLWETVEVQAKYIAELNERIDALEEK